MIIVNKFSGGFPLFFLESCEELIDSDYLSSLITSEPHLNILCYDEVLLEGLSEAHLYSL